MLSPSSPAQKNLGDEDSSGSDAGSEAGLEPETDRFGFIVTNGSTAGSVGPPPELVRQREAKWINIIAQWDRILLKKTSKVKVQCQKGIPASLRAKCWPLLCGATDRMKQSENLYQSLDSQPALQSWVDVIERDLDRQFPFHEMFLSKDGHGQRGLFRVLKAYTQYQPEEGYCQAQGPVAAVLLMNMPAEEAFWCLVQISEQYLPGYYSPLLEGVLFDAAMLTWVLKRTCPAAHKHLQHHGVEPLMFATDWLMCLFTRHLPFNTLLRVWDLFFCYGVRVLLQVAVVLVRRVLGRAEQRKQCQGQMETLERLRGVREQVQEEDDSFIAEVCSVPLSARDLDKQTEKELEKWRKDRPSSTFDPRGRCYGYRMAWARARQNEEERNRKEREKGNLSIPLARSASTLSLSPSILHKKWRKGGKVNAGEWEGGGRVVRHLSMGAKEDWSSWADIRFKKVQGVQEEEDTVSEEHEEQNKPKQSEQKETTKMDTIQNIPTEHVEETVIVKEQVETRITEKEESQHKETETEESKMLSEQTEETNVETEPNQGPAKHQTVDNILQQGEELDSSSPSQVLEQQSHKSKDQDIEVKDKNKETEIQEAESEPTAAVQEHQTETQKDPEADTNTEVETEESVDPSEEQMIQADMKPEESLETENVQQTQVDTVTEVSETATETSPGSQTNGEAEAPTVKDATVETEIQEQQQEAITETQEQQQEAITETQEQQQEAITETQEQQQEAITETQEQQQEAITEIQEQQREAITETQEQQREAITETQEQQREAITETQEQQQEAITEIQEQQQEAITETQEQQREAITETQEQQREAITETQEQQREAITETQEQQREAITEIDNSSQGDAFEQKYHSTESLAETELKEEPHTQTETETDVLAQNQKQVEKHVATSDELDAEIVQIDSEQNTDSSVEAEAIILCSPECVQPKEGADLVVDTEIEVEIPVSNDTVTQSSEAFAQCSEKVVNAAASEPTEEEGEILTAHSEGDNDETQAKETPIETQMKEETTDSTEPSAQAEAVNPTAEPDGETSSVEVSASEPEPEPPKIQGTMGAVEEEESPEDVQEDTVGENDVFISTEPTDSNTDSNAHVQDTESHCPKDQTEPNNSSLTQASGRRNSRSSGDFCVRKSSSSRGSRLGRRLSEDLFTVPQKTSQSESIPNQPEVKRTESQSSPGAVNPTQTPPDVTSEVTSSLAAGAAERTEAQQEQKPPDPPKRFGLFRRLRGDQPKKAKAKGAAKMQVPKILIQDFSDGTGMEKPVVEEEEEEKLSSRERRRRRREQERREKEEERLRKKKEKELEKEKGRERRKPQTRGKSFQVQREKGSSDEPAKTASQTKNVSYAESYF